MSNVPETEWVKELQWALNKWRNWVFQQGVTGRLKDPRTQSIKAQMTTEGLLPVTEPALLYPTVYGVRPRRKDYICPRCRSTNRTRLKSVLLYEDQKTYGFTCHWCKNEWRRSSKLILNELLEEQIERISKFTKKTGKEFGALIFRTNRGIELEMVQIGEDRSVALSTTRKLQKDEEILGTWHCIISPSTLVETDNGRKPITKIKVGDNILSRDGLYHKVLETKRRIYSGNRIRLTVDYNIGGYKQRISLTPEHLVFVQRNNIRMWVQANNLTINDFVLIPEYMFDTCKVCGKIIELGKKVCSFRCNAKRIHTLYPEMARESGKRLKLLNKNPEFRRKIQLGCIKRNARPEYHKKLSKGVKRAIQEGRLKIPEGFRNEETLSKAWDTLRRGNDGGSYWERRLLKIMKMTYPKKDIRHNYEVKGEEYLIYNQFGKTTGKKHRQYFLDIVFLNEKIDIEVDGKFFHAGREKEDKQRDEYLTSKGWKVQRIPAQKIANGTFWELLKNVLDVPNFVDPPIKFIPRKIVEIDRKHLYKRVVFNLEVEHNPSFIAGRIIVHNCHPVTDEPSYWDVATFLRDKWEVISCVSGAKDHLTVMIKTDETVPLKPEGVRHWEEENRTGGVSLVKLAEKHKFLLYRGKSSNLRLVGGDEKTTSLEKLVKKVRGVKKIT